MSFPANLVALFRSASVRTVSFPSAAVTQFLSPPSGKRWLVIGGSMYNAAANACTLIAYSQDAKSIVHTYFNRTSAGAGHFPLFDSSTNFTPVILKDTDVLQLAKVAGDYAVVTVLEW